MQHEPTLSIVIPTIGRVTLARTLESIKNQRLIDGDQVVVVGDGDKPRAMDIWNEFELPGVCEMVPLNRPNNKIFPPRNRGVELATADFIGFMDDDDYYTPGAFDMIRTGIAKSPFKAHMFKERLPNGTVVPDGTDIERSNFGQPCFLVPNHDVPKWVENVNDARRFTVAAEKVYGFMWHQDLIAIIPWHNNYKMVTRKIVGR